MEILISLGLLLVGLAYRAVINRGQTRGTPDEKLYSIYAHTWRPGKVYTKAVEAFLSKPSLEIPPTRFGFFAICSFLCWGKVGWTSCYRTVTWVASVSAALAAPIAYQITKDLPSSLLIASSPLSLLLSRRALQDSFTGLLLLCGLWAVHAGNPWFLGVATAFALISREAVLLYLPALFAAWIFKAGFGQWLVGAVALSAGTCGAIVLYYAVGGRRLLDVFRKLRQPTDYVRRFQSGMPHRFIVDFALASPVVLIVALTTWFRSPVWLLAFVCVALAVHSAIIPKNLRFLLVVDIVLRMLCAGLPGQWPWVFLGIGTVADLLLYRAFGRENDPVTISLTMKTGMYRDPGGTTS